jgi:hypothetical protein
MGESGAKYKLAQAILTVQPCTEQEVERTELASLLQYAQMYRSWVWRVGQAKQEPMTRAGGFGLAA